MLGEAIIKGLAVTAKNFFGSYVSKERLPTIQYPEARQALAERVRNFPFLVYDGGDWEKGLRCVACQICEKECPPKCIYIKRSSAKKPNAMGRAQFYPVVFDIDTSVCMGCQICVEVCPFDSIKMNNEFELCNSDRFGALLLHKQQLARSSEYYHQLHPGEAAEADARLAVEKARMEARAKAKMAAGSGSAQKKGPA